jgi:hypothetical protein
LHADDTPHSIALGAAIAMFIAIVPLIGLQTLASVALAALFRANKAICVPVVWVSNPFTMLPILYGSYEVGRFVLRSGPAEPPAELFSDLSEPAKAVSWVDGQFWTDLFYKLLDLGLELWIGSAIIGLVLAIATYPLVRWLVSTHRERHRRHLLQKQVFRVPLPTPTVAPKSEVA